jgi:hypothetical protein
MTRPEEPAGLPIPRVYRGLRDIWTAERDRLVDGYTGGETSFVPALLPEIAVELPATDVLGILRRRLGDSLDSALDPATTDPEHPASAMPAAIASPVAGEPNGRWLRRANMVGINVRTVGTFWHVVGYMLTVPGSIDSVHLLPIWEPGVVDSLYGMASWQLNTEFFSAELADEVPHLDSVEKQLRAVVNLLHAGGRTVGMDVIPHADRYSEMSLAQPHFFEWLQRQDLKIVDHRADLHREVQGEILRWLADAGPAIAGESYPDDAERFFGEEFGESARLRVMFGLPRDRIGRNERRAALVRYLAAYGFEPVPATMGTPFRGIEVDTRDEAMVVDDQGNTWRDYVISEPLSMSRVFDPLARYKLYERLDDNRRWEIDFDTPRPAVWEYVTRHYAAVQRRFGFDFMRGDMSHVQMRPKGVPREIDEFYDILGAVKDSIREQNGVPFFGYFAETFLPPRDIFGYGEEIDHLEASDADTTQGDLQSTIVGSHEFVTRFRQYLDLAATRRVIPAFTVMTPDKDDPRFDEFYLRGNEVRAFIATFLTDIPSYVGLGFETRDAHLVPWPNEHYTKLFVFHEHGESNVYPSKARRGDRYLWGKNGHLFAALTRLRLYAERVLPEIGEHPVRWLIPPDARQDRLEIAWTHDSSSGLVFVANLETGRPSGYFGLPAPPGSDSRRRLGLEFSTVGEVAPIDRALTSNGRHYRVESLEPGEGRVYRVQS